MKNLRVKSLTSYPSRRKWWLATASISIIGLIFQVLNWRHNLMDLHTFRQTHTAMSIREFMDGNWSLSTPFTTLGPPWQMAYEFPLFQAVAAIFGNGFGLSVDATSRITGLGFFILTGILLAILVRRWFGPMAALLALAFLQFLPFGFQWGSSSLIEFTAVSCVLGSILAIEATPRKFPWTIVLLATVLLALGSAVKGTTAVAWALVFLIAGSGLMWRKRPQVTAIVKTAFSLVLGIGVGLLWTIYADSTKLENPVAKYLTSEELYQWTYGTFEQRTNLDQWDRIFERLPSLGASLWIFIVLLTIALWKFKLDLRIIALASVPIIATSIFFNLYVVHSYYLSAIYPAYVAVMALGVISISHLFPHRVVSMIIAGVLSALLIFFSWTSAEGRAIASLIGVEGQFPEISKAIAESTPPEAGVIVAGCDWDPTPLYYADRRGMAIPPWYYDGIPVEWVGNDLTYLAFCGEGYSVSDGDPATILPSGSLFTAVAPGIYRVVGPVKLDLLK